MKKIIFLSLPILFCISCNKKEKDFDATGIFEATEITVSAQASGEVQQLDITEGQSLDSGARVGQIDVYQLVQKQNELEAAKQQIYANKAATDSRQLDLNKQLASLQQQISHAQRERQRFARLVQDGAVARKLLDDINDQISLLQRQLEATRDQFRSTNASLADQIKGFQAQMKGVEAQQRQLERQIQNATIVAPKSGVMLEQLVKAGEFVGVGKPLFKLAQMDHLYLRAYVTSAQLKSVMLGQKAKVYADYGGGQQQEYVGKIAWISSRSEFTPKTIVTDDERADLVYAVKILIKNDGRVKIGMYGEVKF
ncbi:MAG: HlyD family efflux transporter periplasmic adaptor subunit [Alloprevotella sp.]|nr:HlyD family efflux transporter periplasmic adaptor subunit [Alloprevotella sp.]